MAESRRRLRSLGGLHIVYVSLQWDRQDGAAFKLGPRRRGSIHRAWADGGRLALDGERLGAQFLNYVLVRLAQDGEVLVGEVAEVVGDDRFAEPPALQISDVWGDVQRASSLS